MNRARVVDGHIRRDNHIQSNFSIRRLLIVVVLASLLIITNPANELRDRTVDAANRLLERLGRESHTGQKDQSDWAWKKMLDPPISVTNYGILTVEERHSKVDFLLLTTTWSCSYFDARVGSFCSALGVLEKLISGVVNR